MRGVDEAGLATGSTDLEFRLGSADLIYFEDRDARSLRGKQLGRDASDAGSRTGNQCNFAIESTHENALPFDKVEMISPESPERQGGIRSDIPTMRTVTSGRDFRPATGLL